MFFVAKENLVTCLVFSCLVSLVSYSLQQFKDKVQIDCFKEGHRLPYSLNSPHVQQELKITALGRGKIEGQRLVQISPGKK